AGSGVLRLLLGKAGCPSRWSRAACAQVRGYAGEQRALLGGDAADAEDAAIHSRRGSIVASGVPTRMRLIAALTLSFTIYLVPVFTAHSIDLFGPGLGQELFGDREPGWKAADVAFAVM